MIDYAIVCQTIEDWRAGKRPTPATLPPSEPVSPLPTQDRSLEAEQPEPYDRTMTYGNELETSDDEAVEVAPEDLVETVEPTSEAGPFDFTQDLGAFFVAEHLIEQAANDPNRREELFHQYGIAGEDHYQHVRSAAQQFVSSGQGQPIYGDAQAIGEYRANAIAQYEEQSSNQQAVGVSFEAVEGLDLGNWARGQAQLAMGAAIEQVAASLNMDAAHWERSSAEWNRRMADDTSMTISNEYSAAYAALSQGVQQPAAPAADGAPPVELETYVDLEQALAVLGEQGFDPEAVLGEMGVTVEHWNEMSSWWSAYLSAHAQENPALYQRYTELQAHYRAQYMSEE